MVGGLNWEVGKEYLEGTDFYLEERNLQVAERLREVSLCQTEGEFGEMVRPILKWVNVATDARKGGLISGTEMPDNFEFSEDDIRRYFSEWLPEQMGVYLGRLHQHGVAHCFSDGQNWSAVGTMYDLDGVKGHKAGSRYAAAGEDLAKDVRVSMGALEELLNPDGGNYLSRMLGEEALVEAKARFIGAYKRERFMGKVGNPNYKYFRVNDYYDGNNWHKRVITEEDWGKIMVRVREMYGYDLPMPKGVDGLRARVLVDGKGDPIRLAINSDDLDQVGVEVYVGHGSDEDRGWKDPMGHIQEVGGESQRVNYWRELAVYYLPDGRQLDPNIVSQLGGSMDKEFGVVYVDIPERSMARLRLKKKGA